MTSIRDISNNIIRNRDDYGKSCVEFKNIYDQYDRMRHKLRHLTFEDRGYKMCKHIFDVHKANEHNKYLRNKYNNSYYLTGSHIKSDKLSTTKLKSLHPEICGVCMEQQTHSNIITTSCQHHFCKRCLSSWIRACVDRQQEVSCALCRDTNFTIKQYISKTHK
jgi:hypothetical protein